MIVSLLIALFAIAAVVSVAVIVGGWRDNVAAFQHYGAAVRARDWHDVVRVRLLATSPLSGLDTEPSGTIIYTSRFKTRDALAMGDLSEAA